MAELFRDFCPGEHGGCRRRHVEASLAEALDHLVAAQIGGYKKAHNLPALDAGRERAKLQQIANSAPEALRDYTVSLYSLIFKIRFKLIRNIIYTLWIDRKFYLTIVKLLYF